MPVLEIPDPKSFEEVSELAEGLLAEPLSTEKVLVVAGAVHVPPSCCFRRGSALLLWALSCLEFLQWQ